MPTTVAGNLKTLLGVASVSGVTVRFTLNIGPNHGQARVSGVGVLTSPYIQDFTPDATGAISGSIYSNDVDIELASSPGSHPTWYDVVVWDNGVAGPVTSFRLLDATTFNLNTATPITTAPVVPAPTGDGTYLRLDGGNQPTANISFGNKNIGSITNASIGGTLGVTGATTLSGGGTFNGSFTVTNTGTETLGTAFAGNIGSFLSGLHAPSNTYRTTTESAQPDNYPTAEFVNYQPSGGTNAGGKTKPLALQATGIFNSTGEHGGIYAQTWSAGSGDNAAVQGFAYYGGLADDSGGEGAEGGRFQADATSLTIFSATVSSATNNGSTFTLGYSSPTNEASGRGVNRWIIRTDGGTYTTGTISTFAGTGTITVTGAATTWATTFGAGAHSDLVLAVNGDTIGSFKFAVPITSITDDTHLVITYQVNGVNQAWPSTNTGAYTIYRASKISDVSTLSQIIVTNGYTGWANGQTFESPIGYNGHVEGVRSLIFPGIPWGASFPANIYHGVNMSTRAVWGTWFDSTGPLSRGVVFSNTWAAGPGGDTGGAIDINTNPTTIIQSRDTTNATNIFLQTNTAITANDVFKFDPSNDRFGFGTTGAGATFNVNAQTGKIVTYGTASTAGNGAVAVFGSTSQKSESAADANVLTFTPPAVAGTYRINFVLSLSAATAATLGWTATWKDSNAAAQAPTNLSLFQEGAAAPALTFVTSAAGNYYGTALIDIDSSATNIVIKLTFTGTSFAGKASATVERLI